MSFTGVDPGFQVRGGAHLKKNCRAEGGAKYFGVFRVENHDFTPKNKKKACPPLDPPLIYMFFKMTEVFQVGYKTSVYTTTNI